MRQVDRGLAALVLWDGERGRGVVDRVDAVGPRGGEVVVVYPGGVFVFEAGDDELGFWEWWWRCCVVQIMW